MPLKNRIKNYAMVTAVVLGMSIFLTLRVCECPDIEGGCSTLQTYDFYQACLAPHWKSVIWDALAVLGVILTFRWFRGTKEAENEPKEPAASEQAEVAQSDEPAEPEESATSEEPAEPEESAAPEEPAEPEESAAPEEPTEPEESAEATEPDDDDKSEPSPA